MHIRTAGAEEMLALRGEDPAHPSPTARFNCENIRRGSATLFVWDRGGALAGELYLFRSLSDPDFADGKKRAYLCALRVREDLRGRGLGTALMEHVIAQAFLRSPSVWSTPRRPISASTAAWGLRSW